MISEKKFRLMGLVVCMVVMLVGIVIILIAYHHFEDRLWEIIGFCIGTLVVVVGFFMSAMIVGEIMNPS